MFRHLPVFETRTASLEELGRAMIGELEDGMLDEPLREPDEDENTSMLDGELRLPAGYTYFGQFVDHDITFDPVSSLVRQNDPNALVDFRTPRFDLDSLYGGGPATEPYLYEADEIKLALGAECSTDYRAKGPDLLRVNGRALVGDPRNDENLIVSQLQVTFVMFHNAVVDLLRDADGSLHNSDLFKLAQKTVRWHYQWVVIHDFLRRLVNDEVIEDILCRETYATPTGQQTTVVPRLRFYHWNEDPFMPVEFSVAAYRYGHSMARPSYLINDVIRTPVVRNAHRIPLFSQAGRDLKRIANLNGFGPLPADAGIQWKYFLAGIDDAPGPDDAFLPQPSYKIDTTLSHPLGALPDQPPEANMLSVRNLLRGRALGLPAGQDVARAMGIEPLSAEKLLGDVEVSPTVRAELGERTPLWFYVLKEAQLLADGDHLGPAGGRIVAEVLIGLLAGDPLSYLSVEPTWKPFLPAAQTGAFTLSDLVNFGRRGD
jgi:hypothetical protein